MLENAGALKVLERKESDGKMVHLRDIFGLKRCWKKSQFNWPVEWRDDER